MRIPPAHQAQSRLHVHRHIEQYGTDTLSYFALREDKHWFFSSDGRALIGCGRLGRWVLASGDPIGPRDSWRRAVDELARICDEQGLELAFLSVREENLDLYERVGHRGTYLGDETLLDPTRFSLEGRRMRDIRQPYNKVRRRGYTVDLVDEGDLDEITVTRLRHISTSHHDEETEHGFTMALTRPLSRRNRGLLIAIARNSAGVPEAFIRFVPCFGESPGWSLDIMRRSAEAPNGINEFLISATALELGRQGVKRMSLSFAPYRRFLDGDAPPGAFERIVRWCLLRSEPVFQISSLVLWNRKFRPNWAPLYIACPRGKLASAALRYVIAEGFVGWPRVGRLGVTPPRELELAREYGSLRGTAR